MSDERLRKLLSSMDVPSARIDDMPWLARNLAINNSDNPAFAEAIALVKNKIRDSRK
jgi:hypothetical protein